MEQLFANERETNFNSTIAIIEDVLIGFGHMVHNCREENPGAARSWSFQKGSATIHIHLIEHPNSYRIRVSATVMTLHNKVSRDALFTRLLSLNATQVTGAAFALQDPYVLLLSERSTLDLDQSEVRSIVDVVGSFADDFDDALVQSLEAHWAGSIV